MITTVQDNLAKLMSTEDITVIQKPESTAYFDTKKRVLVIPTWKNLSDIMIESLIGHEIGHALYTDSEEWIAAVKLREPNVVFRDYLNVVEDARIESLVKQRYPGMKKIFYHGYKQIIDNKIIEIEEVNDLPIIDRLNVYFKFNGIIPISLSKREEYFIEKIESITEFSEVINIALELFDSEKHNLKNSPSDLQMEFGDGETDTENDSETSMESDSDSDSEEDDTQETPRSESVKKTKTAKEKKGVEQKDKEEKVAGGNGASKGVIGGKQGEIPSRSKTLQDLDNSLSDLVDTKNTVTYVDIPSPILDNIIQPFEKIKKYFESYNILPKSDEEDDTFSSENTLASFNKTHKANIALHKQLFEMRKKAHEYNKTMTFRTGSLDTNKLYSYKYNDQIFKTFEVKPNGKNHGLVFIMDFSGSMSGYLTGAKAKALELIMFCKQTGIPFVLYGFFDTFREDYDKKIHKFDTNVGKNEYTIGTDASFRLLEILSSRMSDTDFKKMVKIFLKCIGNWGAEYSLGGTPLSETHLCLDALVQNFRNNTNTRIVNVIYFTDGAGNSGSFVAKTEVGSYNANPYYSTPTLHTVKGVILHDPKTKKNYDLSGLRYLDSGKILSIIKSRMKNVNVINFLITGNVMTEIPEDLRNEYFGKMGHSQMDVKNMSWKKRDDLYDSANSEYVVIEQIGRDSFDSTFVCSVEMFRKTKNVKIDKNCQDVLQETVNRFSKTSKVKKRVNMMISKFVDLIV